jgi:oxygen-independent coproporphyrinogen-3 oxidase
MLGLRLIQGLDRRAFRDRYRCDVCEAFPRSISRYQQLGALEVTATHVRIAASALFVCDAVLADILSEA